MDVSIILVNYNTKELTQACIDSIFDKTRGLSFEVILIDNDSQDGSQELFSKDERIKFIESGANLGFGKANNLGLKHSSGEFIFFLNTDTLLVNNAIEQLHSWLSKNRCSLNVAAVGCLLQNKDGERIHSHAKFPNAWQNFKSIWTDHICKRFGKEPSSKLDTGVDERGDFFEVDYVTGADLFVHRDVLNQYGAFDPDFFMYYEESEMQFRWNRNGYKNFILRGPQIIHLEGGSQKNISCNKLKRDLKSRLIYFKKTMSRFSYIVFRLLYPSCFLHLFFSKSWTRADKIELFKILVK